ncbi:ROK family transcriptional regulator [Pelosinus baikalensis]|uniref:ROK family transcriptional regulator n=1 Tax=Pelosinus baikalensis TaxID=2892015 RepID=A0ABS8HUX7_9FIRM|nr:ROK family transcriptional regulator [Pelosinus baikalensis]MCC5466956.1 ROK family transcriptional regulator [Pelosinus baikalensis]
MRSPGNSKYVKKLNRMTIINIIKDNELISRQQIAELTGLTPPAITGIIRELIDTGFVREVGLGQSQGGRKPVNLQFNCSAGYVIGIEVTSQEITVALADLKNIPTCIGRVTVDMKDPAIAVKELIRIIKQVSLNKENREKKIVAIAIAFPGMLNRSEGTVKRAVNLGKMWNGYPLKATLENEFGLPIYIETNSKVAALGEKWYGGGINCENLIYINMGEGISAGIIMGEHIVQGSQGYAGQIGHTVMIDQGTLCNCGNRGCLETICGIPALVQKVNAQLPFLADEDPLKKRFNITQEIQINDIVEVALEKESYARDVLRQATHYVALATSHMINLYNPDAVFIGGKLAIVAEFFMEDFHEVIASHTFSEVEDATAIIISKLGADSGVIGACALALKMVLKSPNTDMFDDL